MLQSKDLMIGDWVLINKHPMKVTKLSADKEYDNCDPIPINSEILNKNKWKTMKGVTSLQIDSYFITWVNKSHRFFVEFRIENQYEVSLPPVHYVHELQHILRICGLDELADNFKV